MKMFFAICAFTLTVASAYPQGAQVIIKNRAKELQNQNNVRQGVPPPRRSRKRHRHKLSRPLRRQRRLT